MTRTIEYRFHTISFNDITLIHHHNFVCDVSNDGKNLLVTAKDSLGTTELRTIRPDGATRFTIASGTGSQPFPDASYSPNGREVAMLWRATDSDPAELWLGMNAGSGFFSLLSSPPASTDGLYSIDWVRR